MSCKIYYLPTSAPAVANVMFVGCLSSSNDDSPFSGCFPSLFSSAPSSKKVVAFLPLVSATPMEKETPTTAAMPQAKTYADVYETDQRLGHGSYGTVYTCHPKSDANITYAVKVIDRTKLTGKDDAAIFREVDIMKEVSRFPYVVQLVDFYTEARTIYMVQVYAAGGDVFDRLSKRSHYSEKDARDLTRILLETLQAIHSLNIVHRDLKPENLLLKSPDDDASVLVADFGFARHVPKDGNHRGCRTRCGTPAFVAPEIVRGDPYDTGVDLWSAGCLLYFLLGGYPPFTAANHRALFRKIRAGDFMFHEKHFENVSTPAKQLISHLLTVSVTKRWTSEQALQSDWLKESASKLDQRDLSSSLQEMRKFNARRKWRSTAKALGFAATAPFWVSDKVTFNQQMAKWDQAAEGAGRKEEKKTDSAVSEMAALSLGTSIDRKTLLDRLPTIKFKDVYEMRKKVRSGSFATVWEVIHKTTKEVYAAKIIKREGLSAKDDEVIMNEVAILQSLSDNKYVVHLMDFYEEDDNFYIVMEYMPGGDVFDRIVERTHYTEKDARDLVKTLLKATASLHKVGIAHRDLKPQNLLLSSRDANAKVKLADFGFSRRVHTPESLTTRMGTPTYVAPEMYVVMCRTE